MKAHIDGVVDAGVIVDDDWKHLRLAEPPMIVPFDPENPEGVAMCFERID
jgi:hypothetical protein